MKRRCRLYPAVVLLWVSHILATDQLNVIVQPSPPTLNGLRNITYLEGKYFAFGDKTVWTSTNLANWHAEATPNIWLNSAIHGNSGYVAVGQSGVIMQSSTGDNWIRVNSGVSNNLNSVAFGSGLYVAVGGGSTPWYPDYNYTNSSSIILTSLNGLDWTQAQLPTNSATYAGLRSIAYGNGKFVAVGEGATILTSSEGANWAGNPSAQVGDRSVLHGVCYGNGRFVIVGANDIGPGSSYLGGTGDFLTSTDGNSWAYPDSFISFPFNDSEDHYGVAYGNGIFVAVGIGLSDRAVGEIISSTDGMTLLNHITKPFVSPQTVVFGSDSFAMVTLDHGIFESAPFSVPMLTASVVGNRSDLQIEVAGAIGAIYQLQLTSAMDTPNWKTSLVFTNTNWKTTNNVTIPTGKGSSYWRVISK